MRRGKFANFENKIICISSWYSKEPSKWDVSFENSCCLHVSFCLSRVDYQVRLKLLWTMLALIFHACVGRSGSIEGLLVRDSQTSESLCCVLEQDTETGIYNRRIRNRPDPTGMKKNQIKQTFYRLLSAWSTQVDPSRQDRKIVDSDVKNQAKQIKTSKRTNQMLLLCPLRLNSY